MTAAAGIAYDQFSRGRIHKVWLWSGGAVLACQVGKLLIAQTPLWLTFAHAMAALWPA